MRTSGFYVGLFGLSIALLLGGCSAYNMLASGLNPGPDNMRIESPQRLHSAAPSASAAGAAGLEKLSTVTDGAIVPLVNYTSAMRNAFPVEKSACNRTTETCSEPSTKANLENYLSAGIGLVNDYCDRWFEVLERSEKRLNYQIQNDNVIKQLGTTLLGIGSANRAIVATYGAFNTATAGFEDSFKGAFLFAPSANRAHVLVKAALAAKEAKLREKFSSGANRMPTFIEIYNDLVSYGDVCTDSTARRLITDSVSAATASVAPDGSVVVQPNISRETVIAALTLKLAQTKAEEAESKFRDAERELATLLLQRTSASNDSARLTQLAKDKEREIAETAEQVKSAEAAAKAAADSLAAAQKKLDGLPSDASSDARSAAKKEVEDAKIAKGIAEGALAQVKARSNAAQQAKTTALDQAKEQDAIVQSADKLLGEKRQAVIAAKKVWDDAKAAIPSK